MILFLTALREERKAVQTSWRLSPAGSLQGWELLRGERCAHICSGMGAQRMRAALEFGLKAFQPNLVVLVGYSVGLKRECKVGDLLCDERSSAPLKQALAEGGFGLKFGRVATCGFLGTAKEKMLFAQEHPDYALADMESEDALMNFAQRVPMLVVRAVSDEVETDLPLDFSELVTKTGFPDLAGIVTRVLAKPTLVPKLLKLGKEAEVATAALTDFLRRAEGRLRSEFASSC